MYLGILQISMKVPNVESQRPLYQKKHGFYIFHNLVEFRYNQLFATSALICFLFVHIQGVPELRKSSLSVSTAHSENFTVYNRVFRYYKNTKVMFF
jgi:hypothetical protein